MNISVTPFEKDMILYVLRVFAAQNINAPETQGSPNQHDVTAAKALLHKLSRS